MSSVAFVSHGGGPMPVLGDPGHQELVSTLQDLTQALPKQPSVIVVLSAHWETASFEITSAAKPELIYDYYGFPEESYQLQYPAPGAPELAQRMAEQLNAAGVAIKANASRGFDHGMFIPLMLMYPEADIPVLQISLASSLDPRQHWQLGEQLAKVLPEDALVIGSGFSFHNMRTFFAPKTEQINHDVHAFQSWLDETVTAVDIKPEQAQQRWSEWSKVEGGRFCHPREEHLIPLIVCHAIAQSQGRSIPFTALGVEARHFIW
ncbi:DODA-type extradiol aromatic ring-opening family dioxygenase [Marinomonas ostreistagni]|uniref:DODA-type extradiol aromatic ring-opening family dioxygenase n=1 Tax=Marinomonas ostreistagni TaxID=359209 RepID=UPI00194E4AA0|nr:class III extradiol ring-cleavage dioxygenase [Marinomonas ostreistagni]MBM6552036.1 dioxygenase [Marinomonas ostreistagni]